MKHFPFLHEYKPVAVFHFIDTSYGGKAYSTEVTLMCKCGKMKTESLYNGGWVELKDLLSNYNNEK